MSIIITSFRKSDEIIDSLPEGAEITPWSVSRWQPKGYYYDVLEFLGAYDRNGKRLSLTQCGGSLERYKEEWKMWLRKNITPLRRWINSLDNHHDEMLCCWCPYSRATQNQIKTFGSFACHTGLIARFINKARPDITVYLDKDHANNLVPEWKPFKYRLIDI